jgi:hypothetical protein
MKEERRNEASGTGQRLRANFSPTSELVQLLKPAARAPVPFIGGRIELGHTIRSNPRSSATIGHGHVRQAQKPKKGQEAMQCTHARERARKLRLATSVAMIRRARDFPGRYVLCPFFFLLFIFIYFY